MLSQFSTVRPCDRKANKAPGTAALEARARILGDHGQEPAVDLQAMADVVQLAFPGAHKRLDTELPA
ncbi:MAG: hypothetical protein ACRDZX_17740 [Acidimicrobiales bacterium]